MTENPRDRLLGKAVEHFGAAGVADRSLRGIADDLGTSHRMLIHHFGSREGLLAAVSLAVEARQQEVMSSALGDPEEDPVEQGVAYFRATAEAARSYGPLFFEIAAHAAQGREHASEFGRRMLSDWLPAVTALCVELGISPDRAEDHARLALAATRGLLLDELVTGEREAVERAARLLHELLVGAADSAP